MIGRLVRVKTSSRRGRGACAVVWNMYIDDDVQYVDAEDVLARLYGGEILVIV